MVKYVITSIKPDKVIPLRGRERSEPINGVKSFSLVIPFIIAAMEMTSQIPILFITTSSILLSTPNSLIYKMIYDDY